MKPKHTPAPWTNLPRLQCIPICGQDEVGLSLGFINSSNAERTAEGKANAKLIAAAPDLLEALQAARDLWGDYLPPGNSNAMKAMKLVNAAISKATT